MIIKSPAGEFPITIERFEINQGDLVIIGRMGVWDARTHVPPRDFLSVLGKMFFSPAVLLYALRAPFMALRQKDTSRDLGGER
ncbi:MAG: hypothetical protein AB7K04_00205 [Pseudorhodoplanes sp.]